MLVAAINNRLITIVCYGLWAALFAAMVAYFMLPFRFHIAGTIGFVSGAAAWMITGAGVENRSYARIFAKGALVSLIFGFSAPFLVADLPNWQSINSEVLGLYILGGMVLTAVGIPFAFLGTVLFVRVIPMRLAAATAVLWLLVFGAYHFGYRTGLMGLGWPGAFREAIFAGLTHEPPHEIKFAEVFPFDWDEVSFEWGDSFYMCDGKVPPPRWGRFQNIVFTKDGHVVDIFWRFTGETIHLTISNPQPCFIPREEARFRVRTDEWRPGEFSVRVTQIGDDPS